MLYRRGYLYTYQVGVSCIHVRERYPFTFVVIFSVMNRMQCRAGTKTSPGPSSNGSSRTKTDPFKARKIGSSKTKKKKKLRTSSAIIEARRGREIEVGDDGGVAHNWERILNYLELDPDPSRSEAYQASPIPDCRSRGSCRPSKKSDRTSYALEFMCFPP